MKNIITDTTIVTIANINRDNIDFNERNDETLNATSGGILMT